MFYEVDAPQSRVLGGGWIAAARRPEVGRVDAYRSDRVAVSAGR